MPNFLFSIDWIALWISIIGLLCAYLLRNFLDSRPPYLSFSYLKDLQRGQHKRINWTSLPQRLQSLALLSFLIAFIDPHLMFTPNRPAEKEPDLTKKELPTEGIAIYLVLDQSGSMAQRIVAKINGEKQSIRKMDLLKQVTSQFIQDQSSNLIGLVAFARLPHVIAPLTLDENALQKALNEVEIVKVKEEDGTGLGYAIFKTAHLIVATKHFAQELRGKGRAAYEIKGTAIIAITDGLQNPNPLDKGNRLRTIELEEVAAYAKSQDIHLYLINIDPSISSPQFAPHRRLMKTITEATGGQFYLTSETQDLQKIYKDIDVLEKGAFLTDLSTSSDRTPEETNQPSIRFSFYPFFISLGILCLLSSMFLETTRLRKIP